MAKKVLVTGGCGFIGSHLVDRLIKEGNEVVVIDNLSTGKKENLNPAAHFYKADIRDPKISQIFQKEKPEVVFHLAAQIDVRKSVENPIEDAKINILGSLNIIQNFYNLISTIKYPISKTKFIFISSGGTIYGEADIVPTPENSPSQPLSPYGVAKLTIEKYLNYYYKIFGLPYVALRLANVYGPRQNPEGEAGVVAIFCNKLLKGEQPIVYGDGKQTRDYVFVDDVVKAGILALEKDKVGIFNMGTGKETSVNNLYRLISKVLNKNIQPIFTSARPGDIKKSYLDISKIKRELGWEPKYLLEKGLKKTIRWFKNI